MIKKKWAVLAEIHFGVDDVFTDDTYIYCLCSRVFLRDQVQLYHEEEKENLDEEVIPPPEGEDQDTDMDSPNRVSSLVEDLKTLCFNYYPYKHNQPLSPVTYVGESAYLKSSKYTGVVRSDNKSPAYIMDMDRDHPDSIEEQKTQYPDGWYPVCLHPGCNRPILAYQFVNECNPQYWDRGQPDDHLAYLVPETPDACYPERVYPRSFPNTAYPKYPDPAYYERRKYCTKYEAPADNYLTHLRFHDYWMENGERLVWASWIKKYGDYINPAYLNDNNEFNANNTMNNSFDYSKAEDYCRADEYSRGGDAVRERTLSYDSKVNPYRQSEEFAASRAARRRSCSERDEGAASPRTLATDSMTNVTKTTLSSRGLSSRSSSPLDCSATDDPTMIPNEAAADADVDRYWQYMWKQHYMMQRQFHYSKFEEAHMIRIYEEERLEREDRSDGTQEPTVIEVIPKLRAQAKKKATKPDRYEDSVGVLLECLRRPRVCTCDQPPPKKEHNQGKAVVGVNEANASKEAIAADGVNATDGADAAGSAGEAKATGDVDGTDATEDDGAEVSDAAGGSEAADNSNGMDGKEEDEQRENEEQGSDRNHGEDGDHREDGDLREDEDHREDGDKYVNGDNGSGQDDKESDGEKGPGEESGANKAQPAKKKKKKKKRKLKKILQEMPMDHAIRVHDRIYRVTDEEHPWLIKRAMNAMGLAMRPDAAFLGHLVYRRRWLRPPRPRALRHLRNRNMDTDDDYRQLMPNYDYLLDDEQSMQIDDDHQVAALTDDSSVVDSKQLTADDDTVPGETPDSAPNKIKEKKRHVDAEPRQPTVNKKVYFDDDGIAIPAEDDSERLTAVTAATPQSPAPAPCADGGEGERQAAAVPRHAARSSSSGRDSVTIRQEDVTDRVVRTLMALSKSTKDLIPRVR